MVNSTADARVIAAHIKGGVALIANNLCTILSPGAVVATLNLWLAAKAMIIDFVIASFALAIYNCSIFPIWACCAFGISAEWTTIVYWIDVITLNAGNIFWTVGRWGAFGAKWYSFCTKYTGIIQQEGGSITLDTSDSVVNEGLIASLAVGDSCLTWNAGVIVTFEIIDIAIDTSYCVVNCGLLAGWTMIDGFSTDLA